MKWKKFYCIICMGLRDCVKIWEVYIGDTQNEKIWENNAAYSNDYNLGGYASIGYTVCK